MERKRNRRDFLKDSLVLTGGLIVARCASVARREPSGEVANGDGYSGGYYGNASTNSGYIGYGGNAYYGAQGYYGADSYYGAQGYYGAGSYYGAQGYYGAHSYHGAPGYYGGSLYSKGYYGAVSPYYGGEYASFYAGLYANGSYYPCPSGYGYFAKGYYGYGYYQSKDVYGYFEPTKHCEPLRRGFRHRFRPGK